jgi:hypothetical protein
MNRSYSKIRHIQESNMRLERRLINEQVSGATSTAPVAAVETLDQIKSTSPNVPFNKDSVKKYNTTEVVTWNQGSSGTIENTFYKNCNTGALTNTKKVAATQSQNLFSNRLCNVLFPNLQVAVRSREYTAKQAQYIKDNPSQTGAPTQ